MAESETVAEVNRLKGEIMLLAELIRPIFRCWQGIGDDRAGHKVLYEAVRQQILDKTNVAREARTPWYVRDADITSVDEFIWQSDRYAAARTPLQRYEVMLQRSSHGRK